MCHNLSFPINDIYGSFSLKLHNKISEHFYLQFEWKLYEKIELQEEINNKLRCQQFEICNLPNWPNKQFTGRGDRIVPIFAKSSSMFTNSWRKFQWWENQTKRKNGWSDKCNKPAVEQTRTWDVCHSTGTIMKYTFGKRDCRVFSGTYYGKDIYLWGRCAVAVPSPDLPEN